MPTDRTEVLKNAEKLLRTGKLELAIAEYVRLVGEHPRDWNTRNTLGDLYVRANQPDEAIPHYVEIADHLVGEGLFARAATLYRKVLTLRPDAEAAELQLADMCARQGLADDAKRHFEAVAARRRARGDGAGADEIARYLGSLNPADAASRTPAEPQKTPLERAEIDLRAGRLDDARERLAGLPASARPRIVELAWALAPVAPQAAYVCIEAAADGELASGNQMDAAGLLQEFTARAPGQIAAMRKLIDICVAGGLQATMYETQAQLTDAYLDMGQGVEARAIAEDLVAREPWEPAHIDRFRRTLVLLNEPDPDAIIAERLSGKGPFVATDPFAAPVGEPEQPAQPTPAPERDPAPVTPPVEEPANEPPRREPEPDIPLRRRADAPAADPAPPTKASKGSDIDLNDMLSQLHGSPKPAAPGTPASDNLNEMFEGPRSDASRQAGVQQATEQLALARTYLDMGMADEAITALTRASKVPSLRFEAASLLGRIYLKKEDHGRAVEWLERAAEAPAPSPTEGRELLYDLGTTLELTGEVSRALAVFMELQADAGEYRDVAARVDRLVQAGD